MIGETGGHGGIAYENAVTFQLIFLSHYTNDTVMFVGGGVERGSHIIDTFQFQSC